MGDTKPDSDPPPAHPPPVLWRTAHAHDRTPTCPQCGYNVMGMVVYVGPDRGATCPECGLFSSPERLCLPRPKTSWTKRASDSLVNVFCVAVILVNIALALLE